MQGRKSNQLIDYFCKSDFDTFSALRIFLVKVDDFVGIKTNCLVEMIDDFPTMKIFLIKIR